VPGQTDAASLTAVLQSQGHPRILERLLAVVASRSYTLTGIRSFSLPGEPAPWLAMTMTGLPERAHSLLERMAALPHVLTVGRVVELDRSIPPRPRTIRVEQVRSGFRAIIGERSAEATTPEAAVARLVLPSSVTTFGVLTEQVHDGARVIGCVRAGGVIRAAGTTDPDAIAATLAVFEALDPTRAAHEDASSLEQQVAVL
jgi:hypothetical protein